MRTLTFFVVAVAVVVSSCARTVNVEEETRALLAVDDAWSQTARAKDFDKFVSFMSPDATMMLPGSPALSGEKAIRENAGPMWKAPGFDLSWKASRAEVTASGDLGYTVGTYKLTMNNAAGVPVVDSGKFLTTWQKVNGTWKVLDDIVNSDGPTPISSPHVMVPPGKVTWSPGPPNLPPGAKVAVLSGDPAGTGPFTVRVQFPPNYRVAPHWHPTDEHVTVLSGTLAVGMGNAWDDKAMTDLPAGSYVVTSATMTHFALAKTATTIQVSGMGPFVTNYVNAGDDPSKKVK